jgi:3-deoxy-7-phosphoheptulonate synthase
MIILMEPDAPEEAIEGVVAHLVGSGFDVHRSSGATRTILGAVGEVEVDDIALLRELPHVADVVRVSEPYRLASRRQHPDDTKLSGSWGVLGGSRLWIGVEVVGGGPIKASGPPFDAALDRGPRARLSVVPSLAFDRPDQVEGGIVFARRSPSAGPSEWIGAAEDLLRSGERAVALLEAGGAYPDGTTTFDVLVLARTRILTHLPIVVDVAAVAGQSRFVAPVARAAVGAGAHGVILRAHRGQVSTLPASLPWEAAVALGRALAAMTGER